jgi:putative thioredoxin
MDVTNFQAQVIERSQEVPVLVDFWAAWCGPCRMLGPVLEELAVEAQGQWELAKVDTEAHQSLAASYKVMSIPAVKLFFQGEVIGEFTGALPKPQIEAWLEEYLPSAEKEAFQQLKQRILAQDESALPELEALVTTHPEMEEARLSLAGYLVGNEPERAKSLVEGFQLGHKYADRASDIRTLSELTSLHDAEGTDKVFSLLDQARQALVERNYEAALKQLIQVVMIDKDFQDDLPRRACIALFHYLGEQHPLSIKYRPQFNMALY